MNDPFRNFETRCSALLRFDSIKKINNWTYFTYFAFWSSSSGACACLPCEFETVFSRMTDDELAVDYLLDTWNGNAELLLRVPFCVT
jgi:hypothetical protein